MAQLYNVILVLHIIMSIVAFGGLAMISAYNSRALRGTAGRAAALLETSVDVSKVAHTTMYLVAPLGVVLISLSEGEHDFAAIWVSISFVIWFAMIGVAHALGLKNLKAAATRAGELDPTTNLADDPQALASMKQVGTGDAIGQLLLVAALALMIWQPGA